MLGIDRRPFHLVTLWSTLVAIGACAPVATPKPCNEERNCAVGAICEPVGPQKFACTEDCSSDADCPGSRKYYLAYFCVQSVTAPSRNVCVRESICDNDAQCRSGFQCVRRPCTADDDRCEGGLTLDRYCPRTSRF